MENRCDICPRGCAAVRSGTQGGGVCGMGDTLKIARCEKHYWEEPCISGENGSGAVFFSGCSLRCVFCQNEKISHGGFGAPVTDENFILMMQRLEAAGAHNINLVNPTHYTAQIIRVLDRYRPAVPIVYNCGGYEKPETIRALEGYIDIYLPDLKYVDSAVSRKYSGAADYFQYASAAILEMYKQVGDPVYDDDGIMKSGLMVRHLILPDNIDNSIRVLEWIAENLPRTVPVSVMSQYTPCGDLGRFPELQRRLTQEEYDRVFDRMLELDLTEGYIQELSSAKEEYIPPFDLSGVIM